MRHRIIAGVATLAALLAVSPAFATNGYFSLGYGTHARGMAGAGVALHLSSLAPATNPAAMAWIGHRYDLGLAHFSPDRHYSVSGSPSGYPGTFGLAPGEVHSHQGAFEVPNLGANWELDGVSTFGFALFGNGGMNTDYHARTFGFAPTGVDMSQLFLAPTFARKLGDGRHSLGITAIFAAQRFKAQGLQAFASFSSDPSKLTNNGYSYSYGWGARIGYLGEIVDWLSIGAAYQTKVNMSRFDEYAGLFADRGDFDIPSNWTIGVALQPNRSLDVALDVQRIHFSEVASVGNPLLPNLVQAPLGARGGAGFGWRDMTVYKVGLQWRPFDRWALRAGYAWGDQPIPASEVLFNILAPGVMERHASLGFSHDFDRSGEVTFAVTRAFSSQVVGPNPLEAPGAQTIELHMDQWEVEVGYSFGF
ncbi:MAG: outer membrane protein transport protein [Thermoanaerobaculia bacterium]